MKKSIPDIQQELVDEFGMFTDRMQKYEYIIEMGKDLEPLPDDKKVDSALVKGCQSQVWLHADQQNDVVKFEADSDAFIVRGLVSMLLRLFDGQSKKEVANANLDFIKEIGLQDMLSPTRANGLASMIKQMKLYAIALQAKQ